MVKVVWSDSAVADLESIVEYIAQDSEHYAAAFAEKVLKAVEKLGTFPRIGRVVSEYNREDIRELVFQNSDHLQSGTGGGRHRYDRPCKQGFDALVSA